MNSTLSLFDLEEQEQLSLTDSTDTKGNLDVVKAEFIETESLTWEQLFDGFDTLYAITYSSGVDFICKVLKKFDKAEIIFGYDEVMSYNLQEIMAYQSKTIERIKEKSSRNKLDCTVKSRHKITPQFKTICSFSLGERLSL
ncbi:MAG: hypothetical protein FWF76_02035 [Oscillospiraceae bacterium]|nr:hypothetical protein [Oscillospiraceae bacterium]